MRFGDAAIKLGFLTPTDVEFALSRQFSYPYPLHGDNGISEDLVAAHAPFTPQVEALRAVRTQLMLRWFDSDSAHKTLAIVSAEHDEGRSFIAANLAVAFSQLGEHTLLVDADLRDPCQHRLFGLDNRAGLSAVLSGRGGPEAIQRVSALIDLSVLPAGAVPPNPAELLSRPPFEQLLAHLTTNFDIIILLGVGTAAYSQVYIRLRNAQLLEEYVVHIPIVVLAGVDDFEAKITAWFAQGAHYWGDLHEIWPCAGDDGNRLHCNRS